VSEVFLVRDSSAITVSKYAILLMDSDNLDLLDHSSTGDINLSDAHRLASSLAKCVLAGGASVGELGSPLEMDVVFEKGHVKIIFDHEAGLLRVLVDEMP
jgi:hypothetical protein